MNKFFEGRKKLYTLLILLIVVLVVTNPTNNDFADYYRVLTGKNLQSENSHNLQYGRIGYFGIFSTYQYQTLNYNYIGKKTPGSYEVENFIYLGIFNNFLFLQKSIK